MNKEYWDAPCPVPVTLTLRDIGLSVQIINVLRWHGIVSVEKLASMTEKRLLGLGKVGPVTVQKITEALAKQNLSLPS